MRLTMLTAAAALMLFTAPAFAFHCPVDMQKIDAALASGADMALSQEQKDKVKELRASGEEKHKAGDHQGAVDDLGEAMMILGIQ